MNYFSGRYFAEYAREWGKHDFKVVGGLDLEVRKYRNLSGSKKDIITSEVPTINTATNDKPGLSGGYNHFLFVVMVRLVLLEIKLGLHSHHSLLDGMLLTKTSLSL